MAGTWSNMTNLTSTAHNVTLQNITAILNNATSNITSSTTNTTLSGLEIYLTLATSALLGVTQRSISDEFASWTMAPTRVSPFICLADMLSTLLWILHGWHTRLSWAQCARLAVTKSAVSGDKSRREINRIQMCLSAVLFIPSLIQVVQTLAAGHIFWEKVWIVLFNSSYLFFVGVDILATYADDPAAEEGKNDVSAPLNGDDHAEQAGHAKEVEDERTLQIFYIADILSSMAYIIQIKAWVDIYGKVVQTALATYSEDKVNTAIIISISIAAILSLAAPNTGSFKILHGLWSFRNWESTHITPIVICAFIIFLMLGLPHWSHGPAVPVLIAMQPEHESMLRPMISTPLGTLSVVVLVVCVASVLHTLVCKMLKVPIPAEFADNTEDAEEVVLLGYRLNVVVKSSRKWRETLSFAFAILNFVFGALHYRFVYPSIHGVVKS